MNNKQDIIDKVNNIVNAPIAELKKSNLMENADPTKFDALMQYNAMLDHITIGAHTSTTINYAGIDWKLRLLTSEEDIQIKLDIAKELESKKVFEDFYSNYLIVLKVIAKALTPSPFKSDGAGTVGLSEKDLAMVHWDVLEQVYIKYIDFVAMATKKVASFSPEEIELLINVVKKKPASLQDLDRMRLLAVAQYLRNYSEKLEAMLKIDSSN